MKPLTPRQQLYTALAGFGFLSFAAVGMSIWTRIEIADLRCRTAAMETLATYGRAEDEGCEAQIGRHQAQVREARIRDE